MNYELAIRKFKDLKTEVEQPIEELDQVTGLSIAPVETLYNKCNILLHNFYSLDNTHTNKDFFIRKLNDVIQDNYHHNAFHRTRDLGLFIDTVLVDLEIKHDISNHKADDKTVETLREVIKEKEEENKHLSIVIDGHEDQRDDLQRQLKESKKEVSRLQALARNDSGMGMLAKYQGDIAKYQLQSGALEEKERRIFDISAQRDQVKSQVEDLQRKLDESENQKAFADATVDKLEEKLASAQKELKEERKQAVELAAKVKADIAALERNVQAKRKDIEGLREKLTAKDKEFQELKNTAITGSVGRLEEVNKMRSELEALKTASTDTTDLLELVSKLRIGFLSMIYFLIAGSTFAIPKLLGYPYDWKKVIILLAVSATCLVIMYFRKVPDYVTVLIGIILGSLGFLL